MQNFISCYSFEISLPIKNMVFFIAFGSAIVRNSFGQSSVTSEEIDLLT